MVDEKKKPSPIEDPAMAEETQDEVLLVSFRLGKEHFGVEILMVKEIITVPEITRIPNAPPFVEGVINLRGRLVPVIDLRKRLKVGKESYERQTRIVVVQIEGKITGLVVDAVEAVMSVPGDSIETAPEIVTVGVESQYITGVSKLDNRMIILLDFNRLLSKDEMVKLHRIGQDGEELKVNSEE